MSLNKFMHPRNIYKIPPNFSELAVKYPEFLKISKLDAIGKVHIDFKDPNSLRVLTKCLLHSDFGLNVYIPEDRLVPTLPLRLNYILWIEDLLSNLETREQVRGIDIGTGACAVYTLLGAKQNGWRMVGTETDEVSCSIARDNVRENNLDNLITIKYNTTDTLLEHCFAEDKDSKYDFCMCNPPFYGSLQELCESRSDARPPPKNAFTGSLPELITDGGEVQFIQKLIEESTGLANNIKIFTTMVGHKTTLLELTRELRERGVCHTYTEFCQGRTMRWGLAWTFLPTGQLQLPDPPRSESRKKITSMAFVLPPHPNVEYNTESVSKLVTKILNQLDISYKVLKKKGHKMSMEIKAHTNTWSNQRRKRRQLKRIEMEAKRRKESENVAENNNVECKSKEVSGSNQSNKKCENSNEESTTIEETKQSDDLCSSPSNSSDVLPSTSQVEKVDNEKEVILHSILTIGKHEEDIILDMEYLSGSAGKDGMHQVVQYIKNNWK